MGGGVEVVGVAPEVDLCRGPKYCRFRRPLIDAPSQTGKQIHTPTQGGLKTHFRGLAAGVGLSSSQAHSVFFRGGCAARGTGAGRAMEPADGNPDAGGQKRRRQSRGPSPTMGQRDSPPPQAEAPAEAVLKALQRASTRTLLTVAGPFLRTVATPNSHPHPKSPPRTLWYALVPPMAPGGYWEEKHY